MPTIAVLSRSVLPAPRTKQHKLQLPPAAHHTPGDGASWIETTVFRLARLVDYPSEAPLTITIFRDRARQLSRSEVGPHDLHEK